MNGMTQGERKATTALASIFALRMLGLFMIIPVFAVYGQQLTGSTPFLIELSLVCYYLPLVAVSLLCQTLFGE